ncbi:hypothetical protein Gotur_027747, partial [Gossypium turneri]
MRIVSWNIRGLGSEAKMESVKRLIRMSRANICFLQEMKLELVTMDLVRKIWGDDDCEFSKLIVIKGKWVQEEMEVMLINVYAPNNVSEQRTLRGTERSNCMGTEKVSKDFDSFIHNCKLIDWSLLGKKFTWYGPDNKRSRLDRFLLEEFWLIQCKNRIS